MPQAPEQLSLNDSEQAEATIVIFGASGDLTARKLIPALYCLASAGYISAKSPIVGVARRDKTDEAFRNEMEEAVRRHGRSASFSEEKWQTFAKRLFYRRADLSQSSDFPRLSNELETLEQVAGIPGNRIFYMATSPALFVPAIEAMSQAGLLAQGEKPAAPRVVFEKPFGHDLESARELTHALSGMLHEEQIFRIDHYLGKETVQNILLFRFGNATFEPLLNRNHVDHVQISVAESQGMERGRGGYYDHSGALRDVLQNHVLQLLCLVAMEPPAQFRAKELHDEKLKVLQALAPGNPRALDDWAVRGQYTAGGELAGYRQEERIPSGSRRETYVAMDVRIDNWRWAGVPFYLRTGKRLPERITEIAVTFKLPPLNLFKTVECEGDICDLVEAQPNTLIFRIQPRESISLAFSTKRPGMQYQIHPVNMDFAYHESFGHSLPEAYERLLLDVLRNDSTLFMRSDELEAAWKFVTPVLHAWEAEQQAPEFYKAGTWGPPGAVKLLANEGRRWREPSDTGNS